MEFLIKYWPWLLVLISTVGVCIFQLAKDENPNSRNKTWINIILMLLGIAGGIGGMYDTYKSGIAQDQLQRTIDSTKLITSTSLVLTDLVFKLTKQIDSLENLDLKITRNTESLTKDAKILTTKNLVLTNNLNSLTETAKHLVDKIYDEQTSGNSIPLVSASTFADEIIPELLDGREERYPTGKYWLYLDLRNTDNHKLIDVSISSITRNSNSYNSRNELLGHNIHGGDLFAGESKRLASKVIHTLSPQVNYAGDTLEYYPDDDGESTEITVHWRTFTYRYSYEAIKIGKRILDVKDYYIYNGQRFNQKGFMDAILKDKEREKKLLQK